MDQKSKHRKKRHIIDKKLFFAAGVVLAVGVGVIIWQNSKAEPSQITATPAEETINYSPPTEQDKQSVEDNKQRIVDEQNQQTPPTTPDGLKQVSVTVASADKQSVFASVSGVVEDGGTCTATFTNGSTTLSSTSESVANVSYTQCGRIQPPVLDGGNWSVTVSYLSTTAKGSSEPFRME